MEVVVNGSVQVIEEDADSYAVVVNQAPAQVISVGQQGPPGPPGPASPGTTYIFEQVAPSNVWTINHGLNQYPSVTVVDSGGTVAIGTVTYVNSNTIQVTFSVGFGGKAYLN